MKTNAKLILITAISLALGAHAGCRTKVESQNMTANQAVSPAPNQTEKTENTKTEIEKPAADSLSSPTATYKTAFALRQKKDPDGLKKVLSKELLGFLADMAKSENKTLDDQLKELVAEPQAATAESRNEKIVGDLAALEYLDEKGKWKLMGFVKEDGVWKMTFPDAKISAIQDAPPEKQK
jgi:hypothetical protein